ncbi:MAG: DUF47 family protein [Desulfobacteraceae bacterium]|jgi:predicted phosphate transport protein (TIGR00153 family)
MFEFLFKKQRRIEALIYSYLDNLKMTKERFSEALDVCLEEHCSGEFDFLTEQTHKFESRADDIREEIKNFMYGKALIPESRGDIMGLLEAMDEIPGLLQDVLYTIATQRLAIPDFIIPDVKELMAVTLASCDLMFQQIEALFSRSGGLRALVSTIDHNESRCDHIERRIIRKIFDSDLEPFYKLQLKELVGEMEEISDQVDRVSKRANIISLKSRV